VSLLRFRCAASVGSCYVSTAASEHLDDRKVLAEDHNASILLEELDGRLELSKAETPP
jgi:hypothetical protein